LLTLAASAARVRFLVHLGSDDWRDDVRITGLPAAFDEDCARAALVVTTGTAPPRCAATVIDRRAWRAGGALALRRVGNAWVVTQARPRGQDRPWAPAVEVIGGGRTTRAPAATPSGSRDATPRPDDLGVED
jgi:competence protein ComEC